MKDWKKEKPKKIKEKKDDELVIKKALRKKVKINYKTNKNKNKGLVKASKHDDF